MRLCRIKKYLPLNKEIPKEDRLSICCEITVSILKAQHKSYTVIQPNSRKRVLHGVIFSLRRQAQNLVFSRIFYHKGAQIYMGAGRQITGLILHYFFSINPSLFFRSHYSLRLHLQNTIKIRNVHAYFLNVGFIRAKFQIYHGYLQ
jgi:hypothetical protein